MQFLPLLGRQLKDDDIVEVLALLDTEVIYDFDRLHEGRPDIYRAASKPDGLELRFSAAQQLDNILLYVMPHDGFAEFSVSDSDVPLLETPAEAESFAADQRLPVTKGTCDFLGTNHNWVRVGFGTHDVQYEFRRDSLALVKISRTTAES